MKSISVETGDILAKTLERTHWRYKLCKKYGKRKDTML